MPSISSDLKDWLEACSFAVVILGVPAALVSYWLARNKEKEEKQYAAYNALDERYMQFQELCIERPHLDVFDLPDPAPAALTGTQPKEELIAFTMLFAIFERAFIMYGGHSNKFRARQWTGWDQYIRSYCKRANFLAAWQASGTTFDAEFQEYMAGTMKSCR